MTANFRLTKALTAFLFPLVAPASLVLPAASQTMTVSTAAARIERITFQGNRTEEKVLRKHLGITEGDPLTPLTLKSAQTALWDMRQFKTVEVSSAALPGGNAEIDIKVKDGWYLLPFPFFTGGSGGGRGGLLLFSKNVFRQAESIMASASSGAAGTSGALALQREGWSVRAIAGRRDISERKYADGAFSADSGYGSPPDEKDPSRYGPVAESYGKTADETTISVGLPLAGGSARFPRLSAAFGWNRSRIGYSDPAPARPGDPGEQGQAFVSVKAGRDGAGAADSVGAIFGFGLADMERRLAPLSAAAFTSSAGISYHRGAAWTGSDYGYAYFLAQCNGSLAWGAHHSLSLRLAGGHGDGLPPNRLLATGRETGLSGSYAREYRGDSAAGASLVYSRQFRTTRRGAWQGALFAEAARAWGGGTAGSKEGAGASFWYKFWRFPLPLGISATYSFDDRDTQVSAALGGRF